MRKTFTLLIALLALTVSSWAETFKVGDFYYEPNPQGFSYATLITDQETGIYSITGEITIPGTIEYNSIIYTVDGIDNNAFYNCSGITSVTIEEGITSIGANAFTGCYNLTTITLPSSIEDLFNQAFAPSGLTTITINATSPAHFLEGDPFEGANSLAHIYVPAASVDDYKTAWPDYAGIIEAIPAGPASSVTWRNANGLSSIYLIEAENAWGNYTNHDGEKTETIDNVTATISAITDGSYAEFKTDDGNTSITLMEGATLTFSTTLGQFERIVINTNNGNGYKNNPGDWSWIPAQHTLTWHGALPSSTVVLDDAGVDNITSIVFTFAGAAPASDGTITWGGRQANHVSLSCSSVDQVETSSVIKDIITSLEKTEEGEYCEFIGGTMHISKCGELTFQSIVGELTGIVISCSYVENATDLSDDWTYDDGAKTLTWAGTSSNEVTLSGDIYCFISSIEFTYTPVSAPRLGQTFTGSYGQIYEITGLHTAKVIPQSIVGTLDIPDYEVYEYETYYITEIDDYAFSSGDNDIANAYIGSNVAKIGAHAFENNIHMTEVFVYSTVLDAIGEAAFKDCLLLHGLDCYTNMPPALGSNAFSGDTRINRIGVSNTYDYQNAEGWSSYAAKITGSWIAPEAGEIFYYDNQTTVNLYAVVAGATYNTRGQAKVMPYTSDVNAIYPITRTGTLIIPEEVMYMGRPYDVTGIGANAYKDCADVNVVMIPQQMTSIEAGAFLGCMGIKNVFFLWNDPTSITWADRTVGAEFATAVSGNTKIFVPEGTLTAYQTWAPAWASCMSEGEILDVTAAAPDAEDTEHIGRFYRTFYDSSSDYMLPPSVWAHVGYVEGNAFMLRPIAFDGEIIPKGTAVVLESETPSYRLIAVPGDAPAYTGQNDLRGTDTDLAVSTLPAADQDNVYVLNKEATLGGNRQVGMGMYKYTGTTLGAHKAYLIYDAPSGPNTAPARFVFKHENQATGVENVQSDKVQCTKVIRDGQLIIIKDGKEYNAQGLIIK